MDLRKSDHVEDGEGEDGGGRLGAGTEQVHGGPLDVPLPPVSVEGGCRVRRLLHLVEIAINEVPGRLAVLGLLVLADGGGGDPPHLLRGAPGTLEHSAEGRDVSEPRQDHHRPAQRILLDELRCGVEDLQHLRVLQIRLLSVDDLPESVDHGEVGLVLEVDRFSSAGLLLEVLHQPGDLLTDHVLQQRLAHAELFQCLHHKSPLFSPVVALAEHHPPAGYLRLV